MNFITALALLGINKSEYMNSLRNASLDDKVKLASAFLENVKKVARDLKYEHHPDRGGLNDKFLKVCSAEEFINKDTSDFIEKCKERIKERDEKRLNSSRIEIFK